MLYIDVDNSSLEYIGSCKKDLSDLAQCNLENVQNCKFHAILKHFLSQLFSDVFSVEEYHFPLIIFLYVTSITWHTFRVPTTQDGENIYFAYRGRSQHLTIMSAVNCHQN